ncbi:hypothetical protein KGP36_02680 [Patescibacteria group bacterium]|nr:hypothetical protein [Patescibacteria group bacterium]
MTIDIPYKHFKFRDKNYGEVAFIQEGEWTGWIFTRHPDRHWVSLRLANADDLKKIERTMAVMN